LYGADISGCLKKLPALAAGFGAGLKILSKIKDDNYGIVVIVFTLTAAMLIFLKRC
jgi:4-diphosphocytidyl-2C-methyl-D-erythritol kinase